MSGLILVILLWACGAMGLLSTFGIQGFARADRLDEIERKQDITLRLTLAQEICRVYYLRMEARGEVWRQLNANYDARQEEYLAVNQGERYNVRECSMPQ